MSVMIH